MKLKILKQKDIRWWDLQVKELCNIVIEFFVRYWLMHFFFYLFIRNNFGLNVFVILINIVNK